MENKINLYGASGHCKVIVDILLSNAFLVDKIIDDNPSQVSILDIKVLRNYNFIFEPNSNWIISIGNNKVRKAIVAKLKINYQQAIHSSAIISRFSKIGQGTVIMAGVVVNPDTVIGNHCIINTSAVIEHDCIIENFVHISPAAALAGGVTIGEGSHIGIGAVIIQGISIGKWATIGAGAVIINDVPDYATVVGNPGKIIKYKKQDE
jgi:acetyltransferase EpsM